MAEHAIKDALLVQTVALPAADGAVYTTAFDLGAGTQDFVADCSVQIVAPALATTPLPDADTMIYAVQDSADNSTFTNLVNAVITQTGAGAAGAATATQLVRLPLDVLRYVRVSATGAGTIGDCSGSSLTARILT
jgi:hypothetical protein